jgi:hypothetical protein
MEPVGYYGTCKIYGLIASGWTIFGQLCPGAYYCPDVVREHTIVRMFWQTVIPNRKEVRTMDYAGTQVLQMICNEVNIPKAHPSKPRTKAQSCTPGQYNRVFRIPSKLLHSGMQD